MRLALQWALGTPADLRDAAPTRFDHPLDRANHDAARFARGLCGATP
jgi:hypothetical protein